MSKDYYKTLGVDKNASDADIKKAFRAKAMKYHPDKEGGDEAKFKEANEAYQVLSDKTKRAQFDRFGNAGPGGQGFGGFDFSGAQGGFDMGGINLEDILSQAFGGGGGFGFGRQARRGQSYQMDMEITLQESLEGIEKKEIDVPDFSEGPNPANNKKVTIKIPAGVENRSTLRLRGYGGKIEGGEDGDINLVIHVKKHPVFHREGPHLVMDLGIKLTDAIDGVKFPIDYFGKTIKVNIPAGTKSGQLLRVPGKGVQDKRYGSGDLIIKTSVRMPKKLSKAAKKAIETLRNEGF